jgi:two-component system sensor histidine kinase AlgZ
MDNERFHGWRFPLLIAATNTAAAVVATLLYGWFERFDARELLHIGAVTLVYSFSIGTPMSIALPPVLGRLVNRGASVRLLAVCGVLLAGAMAGSLLATEILVTTGLSPNAWLDIGFVLRMCAVLSLAFGIISFFFENVNARLRQTELQEERARKLAAEARLTALQARVHPHFLFNTLNSIASLIPDEPARAEELIGRLSALLRRSLETNQRSLVPLSQELRIARDYLEIERARCGERLRWSFNIGEGVDTAEVPLLALQCLVENSVRHAIAPCPEGGEIVVSAQRAGPELNLEIADTGPGFLLEAAPRGHAVENLAARLQALFGPAAGLETERRDGQFVVRVRIPA